MGWLYVAIVKYLDKLDVVFLVLYVKFSVPPSEGKPKATAIASIRVDFPIPFSPTKNVICTRNWPNLHQNQ